MSDNKLTEKINISDYENIGKKWKKEDDDKLLEYYNQGMDLLNISKLLKRLPGGVAVRLCLKGVIEDVFEIRGYSSYQNSEYVKNYKIYMKNKKSKKENNETENIKILKNIIMDLREDVKNLKDIIINLKDNIDKKQ